MPINDKGHFWDVVKMQEKKSIFTFFWRQYLMTSIVKCLKKCSTQSLNSVSVKLVMTEQSFSFLLLHLFCQSIWKLFSTFQDRQQHRDVHCINVISNIWMTFKVRKRKVSLLLRFYFCTYRWRFKSQYRKKLISMK